jgi:protein-S-isoprenylcysteine O-methyltransferase Ste14
VRSGDPFYPTLVILLVVAAAVAGVVEVRQSLTRRGEATAHDRGSKLAVRLGFAAGYLLAVLAVHVAPAARIHHRGVAVVAGVALIWLGFALRWWAFRTLGRYFTFTVMTSEDQPVVTHGPYQFIRHPGYAGLSLVSVGAGLLFDNWLSLAAMLVLPLVGLLYRIRVEEAALSSALGDDYESYARGRKRLIPFVW